MLAAPCAPLTVPTRLPEVGDADWDAATVSMMAKYATRLQSVSSKLDPYTTVSGYSAYTAGAFTVGEQYAHTQTIVDLRATTIGVAAVASMADDLLDVALHYVSTQTAISGADKTAIAAIEAEAADISKEYLAEIITAADGKTPGAEGKTSGAAAGARVGAAALVAFLGVVAVL